MVGGKRWSLFALTASISMSALLPTSVSAETPVTAARTATATCAVAVRGTPVTYSPGVFSSGSFKVRVESSCVGSGFRYADSLVWVCQDVECVTVLPGPITNVHDCGAVSVCEFTYSFAGTLVPVFGIGGLSSLESTNGQEWISPLPVLGPTVTGCYFQGVFSFTTADCWVYSYLVM